MKRFGVVPAAPGYVLLGYGISMYNSLVSCVQQLLSSRLGLSIESVEVPSLSSSGAGERAVEDAVLAASWYESCKGLSAEGALIGSAELRYQSPLKMPTGARVRVLRTAFAYIGRVAQVDGALQPLLDVMSGFLEEVVGETPFTSLRLFNESSVENVVEAYTRVLGKDTVLVSSYRTPALSLSVTELVLSVEDSTGNALPLTRIYLLRKSGGDAHVVVNLFGSFEELVYAALDHRLALGREGRIPTLPTWLSPVQVRVVPVSGEFSGFARSVAEELRSHGFRAEADDRDVGLGRKIRDAGRLWTPYVVIVGRREAETKNLSVRIRPEGRQVPMGLSELIERLRREMCGGR